jgi:hypothetical protein
VGRASPARHRGLRIGRDEPLQARARQRVESSGRFFSGGPRPGPPRAAGMLRSISPWWQPSPIRPAVAGLPPCVAGLRLAGGTEGAGRPVVIAVTARAARRPECPRDDCIGALQPNENPVQRESVQRPAGADPCAFGLGDLRSGVGRPPRLDEAADQLGLAFRRAIVRLLRRARHSVLRSWPRQCRAPSGTGLVMPLCARRADAERALELDARDGDRGLLRGSCSESGSADPRRGSSRRRGRAALPRF